MKNGTINDITNLKFYTDRGYEIPMQKQYILTWELIPSYSVSKYMSESPKGYFIGDVNLNNPSNISITDLLAFTIERGKVVARFAESEAVDENGKKIFKYIDRQTGITDQEIESYYNYFREFIYDEENKIKVSINISGSEYSNTYNISEIFEDITSTEYLDYFNYRQVYTGDNTSDTDEYYMEFGLIQFGGLVKLIGDDTKSFLLKVFETNVLNIGLYFPFIRYSGDFYQDKISAGFVAANTIVVLEKNEDPDGTISYKRPYISGGNEYSLVFSPTNDSEIKIIESVLDTDITEKYLLTYANEKGFDLSDPDESVYVEPFTFAIGFKADDEGAYLNYLGLYLRSKIDLDKVFFMGALVIKTEVEGEDERFRTLLGNFGVPDPIRYPNIFAELDYQEQGNDYELINRKSKELMLTYDDIFSHVGTYKALFRAIKFLGYNDIIFKEWYTLLDSNDLYTDIAVLIFDSSTGNMLKLKLAYYGVSIEDFKKYNKINRISMVYHLNEEDEDNFEYLKLTLVHYDKESGTIINDGKEQTKLSEVPLTKPIYEYRNEEIIAKLFAVKEWLEKHIIGVNAYISDITGEGVYFGWLKTQGYLTQHALADYSSEQYYTPDVKCVLPFAESHGKIACTLTELNNAIKICDYENVPFNAFIKGTREISAEAMDVSLDISTLYISNTIEAPVLGDEYEFDLTLRPNNGTLAEWTKDGSSQIYYEDGEIKLLFEKYSEAEIDSSCLPIITLENANIHKVYGNWRNNIEWNVRETIDQETGNVIYKLRNTGTYNNDGYSVYNKQYFILMPDEDSEPSIKYSENNKWQMPMFIIHGYKFSNITVDEDKQEQFKLENGDFVLEILKGDINFKSIDGVGASLHFINDRNYVEYSDIDMQANTYEQEIDIEYTYQTERLPFVYIDSSNLLDELTDSSIDSSTIESNIVDSSIQIGMLNDNLLLDISNYVGQDSVSYKEAEEYLDASEYKEEKEKYLNFVKEQKVKEALYNNYLKAYNNNYIFNRCIDASVNRLGEYELLVRAYDKYNNVFVNKYDKKATMSCKPIDIDIYSAQSNTNNSSNFYRFNMDGLVCTSTDIQEIIDATDEHPLFPKNYRIADFDYDPAKSRIEFDNMSYAIDTPKDNDYLLLENYSELCVEADGSTLYMLDENPNRVRLYNQNTSTYIKICIYDNELMQDVINAGPLLVANSYLVDLTTDINYSNDSYITLVEELDSSIIEYINNTERYKTFILNNTEYELLKSEAFVDLISEDVENKQCTFIIPNVKDQIFNNGDVVKIRYYLDPSVDSSIVNSLYIINETAYRITNVEKTSIGELTRYKYIINGLFNIDYLRDNYGKSINKPVTKVVITYANENSVHYTTKVNKNGFEYNYPIDYNGTYVLRDRFNFELKYLFLDDYIDDTYGGRIIDYDPADLKKVWFDASTVFEPDNMDLYYYHNHPLTVKQGKLVVFHHHDNMNAFEDGYHIEWALKNITFNDVENYDVVQNNPGPEVVFRSVNEYLTIKPELIGNQDITLTCIDKYGNKLVNIGSGLLYVKEDKDYLPSYIQMNNIYELI